MASRRAKSPLILTGIANVDAILTTMQTAGANRAVRSGMTAACRVGVKAIKPQIPSTMKDARKTLGFKVKMEKGGPNNGLTTAKYGLGVGKKKENGDMPDRPNRKGKGIGTRNVHWFAMGTKKRFTKSGHPTGQMMANGTIPLEQAVQKAWSAAGNQVMATLEQKTLEAIDRELVKAATKGK